MAIPIVLAGLAAGAGGALFLSLVKFVLRALGFGLVSMVGAIALIDAIEAAMRSELFGIDPVALSILGLARVDDAFAIQLQFALLRVTISGARRLKII